MGANKTTRSFLLLTFFLPLVGAVQSYAASSNQWTVDELSKVLASPDRPQADRDRDANRKPAQTMAFLGVERGMTALDLIAAGGYMTEVLSRTVGPSGKVYMQNPVALRERAAARVADNRLPNVVRVDGDLPNPAVPANNVDVAITALNLHDIYYRRSAAEAQGFMKNAYDALKPGGVFGVIDHAGNEGADNAKLHRIPKSIAIETAKAVGFALEDESDALAKPADDHSAPVSDSAVRGNTDQFLLRFRKPKQASR
jgi:predicted methyltransferase